MNSYVSWYGVNGIMFDEMSSAVYTLSYYTSLNTYAKSAGLNLTMGNREETSPCPSSECSTA